jgi:hypothetical protein
LNFIFSNFVFCNVDKIRLLERVENAMERMGCVRCMMCIPDPRSLMITWAERRGKIDCTNIRTNVTVTMKVVIFK